jgi:protein-disulfide isomerase
MRPGAGSRHNPEWMGKATRNRERAAAAVPKDRMGAGLPMRWAVAALVAAIVLAGTLILVSRHGASGGTAAPTVQSGGTLPGAAAVQRIYKGVPQQGVALGKPNAPVTLVEFGDLQCPFCAQWSVDTLPGLIDEYVKAGKLRIEMRPLVFIGPNSEDGARAVLAAAQQNKGWNAAELFYTNQGTENSNWITEDFVAAVARSIPGIDQEKMLADVDSKAVSDALAESVKDGTGVTATPTFLIGKTGGELHGLGNRTLEAKPFRTAIDKLLAGQ